MTRTLERLDADKNGELSRDEASAAPGQLAATLAGADSNRDGILKTDELKSVASQVLRLSRPENGQGRPTAEGESVPGEGAASEAANSAETSP